MARLMPYVGYAYYNGFRFPAPFDAEVQALPLKDTSKRYIKYVQYTLTIKTLIFPDDAPLSTPGEAVDDNLETIRCRLTKAGGSLIFTDQGLGDDFAINCSQTQLTLGQPVSSFHLDPTFGPFPTLLSWKSAGSNRAASIVWQVQFTMPECCDIGDGTYNPFVEHNFSMNWNVNSEGATVRTVKGFYEVPSFRGQAVGGVTSNNRISQSADNLWATIFTRFPQPQGFLRSSNHELSLDKRQVNYTITDTEIPSDNPYHPYMVKMDIKHRVSGQFPKLMVSQNVMFGTVTIAPTVPRHWGYLAFSKVAAERFAYGGSLPYKSKGFSKQTQSRKTWKLPVAYDFEESIHGREFSFSLSWVITDCTDGIANVFKTSGLFTKVGASGGAPTWPQWTASMASLAHSARGLAEMRHFPAEDILISLCDYNAAPVPVNGNVIKSFPFLPSIVQDSETQISQDQSYLSAGMTLHSESQAGAIMHNPRSDNGPTALSDSPPPNGTVGLNFDKLYAQATTQPVKIIQPLSGPTTKVILYGYAVRAVWPIPAPTVSKIGSITPLAHKVTYRTKQIGKTLYGSPIFGAAWMIELELPYTSNEDILASLKGYSYPEKMK